MFWQMVQIEQAKLTKRNMFWIELAIAAALATLLPLVFYFGSQSTNDNVQVTADVPIEGLVTWPIALGLGLEVIAGSSLGGLLIVILVGTLTAQAYAWRTMQLWLSKGISRTVLLLAKFTAVLLPALLLVITAFVAGAVTTGVLTLSFQNSLPLTAVAWGQVGLSILRTAYTLLPYAALTFLIAVLTRSTAAAVGAGLAYTMLLEGLMRQLLGFLGGGWEQASHYLPGSLSNALTALNQVSVTPSDGVGLTSAVPSDVGAETAVIGIALYVLFFVSCAIVAFQRQDLGG